MYECNNFTYYYETSFKEHKVMKAGEVRDLDTAVQYMISAGFTPSEIGYGKAKDPETGEVFNKRKRIEQFSHSLKAHKGIIIPAVELARALTIAQSSDGQLTDGVHKVSFSPLIANPITGPLSYKQKVVIRDHLQHIPPNVIAAFVLTNPQNVRLAKAGQFTNPHVHNTSAQPTGPADPDRPHGPLTQDEKIHIRDHRQHDVRAYLAIEYSTSVANIRLAQQGQFTEKQQPPPLNTDRPHGPLTQDEKMHIHLSYSEEHVATLANEYNTSPANIRLAQRGEFKRSYSCETRNRLLFLNILKVIGLTAEVQTQIINIVNSCTFNK